MSYVVRPWALRDLKDVVRLIREGATFHKALDQVKTTPEGGENRPKMVLALILLVAAAVVLALSTLGVVLVVKRCGHSAPQLGV
ncbi:collagen alpha-3(V) chain [Platysternon megacephalum]|uniref:Collagen alpha-3(V) chain n=1 Tax=Platysternon megacephalum TaxID=55544 RepID=A0A4D9DJD8_9SAUR|nr:collagen alpha-3(V) chain [Platysternon megacephalum]